MLKQKPRQAEHHKIKIRVMNFLFVVWFFAFLLFNVF